MEAGLALLLSFGMCVLVPIGMLAAIVLVLMNRSRDRHAERMAMIERGIAPAAHTEADRARALGWAVGIVVGGILWMVAGTFGLSRFGIILTAVGVAYLTRGAIGLWRERAPSPRDATGEGGNP